MKQKHIHEGTAKELEAYLAQHPEQRFGLVALSPDDVESTATPNEEVLAMLCDIAIMKASMKPTDSEETDRLLRAARAGAMYGDDSTL